jgi:hypothetical protein
MWYAVQTRPKYEMQGFGKLVSQDDGDLLVTDIIIPPQEVSGGAVETTGQHLHQLWVAMSELEPPQFAIDWPLWFHSHGSMGVFASNEDKTTLEAFATEFGGVAVGLVTNGKEEFYAWYAAEVKTPWGKPFHESTKLDVYVEHETSPAIEKSVKAMMESVKVREVPAVVQSPLWGYPGMGYRGTMRLSRGGNGHTLFDSPSGWHNGVHGAWVQGVFVPDNPDAKPMSRRDRKKARREAQQQLITELEEDEELATSGWYSWMRDQYPTDSPVHAMTDGEFMKFVHDVDADDLPVLSMDALHGKETIA